MTAAYITNISEYDNEEDNTSDSMVDLLTILLFVFLLIMIKLALTGFKIQFLSKDNTYSGGIIRPSLLVTPINFEGKNIINIHRQDKKNIEADETLLGVYASSFSGLLNFIDPGEMYIEDKRVSVLHLKIKGENGKGEDREFIIKSHGKSGVASVNKYILENIVALVWEGYELSDFASLVFKKNFIIKRRPKVYYESMEKEGRRFVIIGDFMIDVTKGLSDDIRFIFSRLATSMMDFVYLGEFDADKRVEFLKDYDGAPDYYYKWNNAESEEIPPFVKYKDAAYEYIKHYADENLDPPEWIKEVFLRKIGANLKVAGQDKEGRLEVR